MIKVCVPQEEHNLQQPQVSLYITLHGAKNVIVQPNYTYDLEMNTNGHSVPMLCQINKGVMILLPPLQCN